MPYTAVRWGGVAIQGEANELWKRERSLFFFVCAVFRRFRRARLAVITRIFGLVIRGQKTDGLVAYADMLNHKKPRDAADTDTR